MYIQISTNNNLCQLECDFCMREKRGSSIMTLENFKYAVDQYCGIFGELTNVDLTPICGEIFLTPNYMEMFEFLEMHPYVKRFDFVTNFLNVDKSVIRKLFNFKKLQMFISVYGHNQTTYKKTTGRDFFSEFDTNLGSLVEVLQERNFDGIPIHFYYRHKAFEKIPKTNSINRKVESIRLTNNKECLIDSSTAGKDYNWGGQYKPLIQRNIPMPKKDGSPCLHALIQNCVLFDGTITMCGMVDKFGKMSIGNIFEDNLRDIYDLKSEFGQQLVKGHYMCDACNEWESMNDEPEDRDIQFESLGYTYEDFANKNR